MVGAALYTHTRSNLYEEAVGRISLQGTSQRKVFYSYCIQSLLIQILSAQNRNFKVGVALEFQNYFLAFVTLDNLVAVRLLLSRSSLQRY